MIEAYINDTNNDLNNFHMGQWYESQEHYSPASGYYLRCAELTSNIDLRYECLIRIFNCYTKLGNRDNTCQGLLKQAIALSPNRPEAYFILSQFYEYRQNWLDSYLYANLGLVSIEPKPFLSNIDYPGRYGLFFQKAAAAWWIGKAQESRQTYQFILDKYINDLPVQYRNLLQNNLSQLGSGPESQAFIRYNNKLHNRLKFKFNGSDSIAENFSQTYQDIFILAILNGKRNGTYLEIGSAKPYLGNNTALLEKSFDWTGVGIEYSEEYIQDYRNNRKNPVLHTDALSINYEQLLSKYFPAIYNIDYLQLDIEPSKHTFEALVSMPLEKYKFGVITYEHDYYVDITKSFRDKSRRYLLSHGYELVVNDISPNEDSAFEDWWVHPDLVDTNRLAEMKHVNLSETHYIERYMLNK